MTQRTLRSEAALRHRLVPYDQRWLVFAINHTFTDEVRGFASGIERSVARKEIAARLAKHLETVRGK